jgi:fibronectin type 3 domain-containing protein
VAATAQTPTQVLVSWTASTDAGTGVAGYRVYRDGSMVALASVTTTSYTDNAVVANTLYSYTVRAFDAATPPNESALSGSVSATTPPAPVLDTTPPSVPGGVTAVAQSASQILVSWTASTDASGIGGYRIYRNGGPTPVTTVQTTNYTDNGLTAATTYSYTVSAVDAANPPNVSAQSSPAASATTTGTPPASMAVRPTPPASPAIHRAAPCRSRWSARSPG